MQNSYLMLVLQVMLLNRRSVVYLRRTFIFLMRCVGLAVFLIYGVLPLIYRYSPAIQRHLVFLPFLRWPTGVDFTKPYTQGMLATRNLYVETEPGVSVGLWHVLPRSLMKDVEDEVTNEGRHPELFDQALGKGYPIVIYLHGNSGSRVNQHRLDLYTILRNLDYHILAFDYRGYADSSQVLMTEDGVVQDALAVIKYAKAKASESPILVWGHSLGTGVASRTVAELCQVGQCPEALILESPFNNLGDEVRNHPLSYFFRFLPTFDWFFTAPLHANNLAFESDVHVTQIDCAILILHAEDDAVIPIQLGKKLYHAASYGRSEEAQPVRFIEFEAKHNYGHKFICKAPEFPLIVKQFVDHSIKL